MVEDLQCHHALTVGRVADDPVQREETVFLQRFLRPNGIEMRLFDAPCERLLTVDARGHGNPLEMREVSTVEIRKFFLDIHIPVQIDVTVRRMIVPCVEIEEHLLRERGDRLWIAARLAAIRRIGIERRHDTAAEQIVGRGECALHLVVDHAAVTQRSIRIVELVVPALLHQHLRIRAHGWIEHRIEVHIHQVLKVAVVSARNGVHRLVWERHRVEERVERALHKLDERFLQRILARAAEHGVLHDVRHARIIHGRRAKTDRKDLVVVCRLKEKEPCPRLLVDKRMPPPVRLRNLLRANQAKAVDDVIYLHVKYPPLSFLPL